MKKESCFDKLGILGWQKIEGIILASILTKKSVLLKGAHGCNKTEGCQTIAEAVFGDSKFVPYDTSLVNADDLLGYIDHRAMLEGRIEYIETPDCIWGATSCLLDEINRCNPYNAAKFFELVRNRTINGRPTGLEFVWAACNPPDRYNTTHMDNAQVSRFVVLDVPSISELTTKEKKLILEEKYKAPPGTLKEKMKLAQNQKNTSQQNTAIINKVLKLSETLNEIEGINFSGRQTKDLYVLFQNMEKIDKVFEEVSFDTDVLKTAVMGLIPECTGLVRSSINKNEVEAKVINILHAFKLNDPILTADGLVKLCQINVKDIHGHTNAIIEKVKNEESIDNLNIAWNSIKTRLDISLDSLQKVRNAFIARAAILEAPKKTKIKNLESIIKKVDKKYKIEDRSKKAAR